LKIRPDQLLQHLKKGLAPIYVVFGDEPLLVNESCDLIRAQARQQGFDGREVHHADAGFDWSTLHEIAATMSLFADRRLIELRLNDSKPKDVGAKMLMAYAERPSEENVLLLVAGKLESATQRSRWFKALLAAGVVVQVWPMDLRQLPRWINQRMRALQLMPTAEAVEILAQRVEGNLLACSQEIEKLRLLNGPGKVDATEVLACVADNARFNVYDLADSALGGDVARTLRIVEGLRTEGVASVLVSWALAREIRSLAGMARDYRDKQNIDAVLASHRVWDKRKPLLRKALQRHDVAGWQRLLQGAAQVDRVVKGAQAGNAWEELLQLSVNIAQKQPAVSALCQSAQG